MIAKWISLGLGLLGEIIFWYFKDQMIQWENNQQINW